LNERHIDIVEDRADQFNTIERMSAVSRMSAPDPYFKKFIQKHKITKDAKGLDRLYNALHDYLSFEADPVETQIIRTPQRTLLDKKGNCVDFSVLTSAFLKNLGIPHAMRMVSYSPEKNFSHIYVVIEDREKVPFDLVLGKESDHESGFGIELDFNKKYDLPIN